jgi:hypothetical protein
MLEEMVNQENFFSYKYNYPAASMVTNQLSRRQTTVALRKKITFDEHPYEIR